MSQPLLRTIHFGFAQVDGKGKAKPLQRAAAMVFTEDLGSGNGLDMVAIPSGSFTMGSPDSEPERQPNEGPQHHVTLASFFISAAPITQAQWLAVVMAHPAKLQYDLNPSPSFFRGIDLPVESITWYQASEYCRRLSAITGRDYRLPSEAQWEYCCRAGSTDPFNVGPTITTDLANYCGTGGAVCGDSDGHSIASDYYGGVKYESGAYGQGPVGIFRSTTTPRRHLSAEPVWALRYARQCLGILPRHCERELRPGRRAMAAPISLARRTATGSCAAVRGRTTRRSAARPFVIRSQPDNPGWQGRIGMRVVCV